MKKIIALLLVLATLIRMLYDEQTASEEMKTLKADIDRDKKRLEERPLSKFIASRIGE